MSCCPETIFVFTKKESSTILYGAAMRAKYGNHPFVTVLYWDGTKYIYMGILTTIAQSGFPVSEIKINHGGIATGIIKIS